MIQVNTLMLAVFIALGVVLVAGLVVVPAIHEAQASNAISDSRNKGQQGFTKSKGNGGRGINV